MSGHRALVRMLWRFPSSADVVFEIRRGCQTQAAAVLAVAEHVSDRPQPESCSRHEYAFQQRNSQRSMVGVPLGHRYSDLSDTTCHIGLMRMRDLTLRQDLTLYSGREGSSTADIFKVGRRKRLTPVKPSKTWNS